MHRPDPVATFSLYRSASQKDRKKRIFTFYFGHLTVGQADNPKHELNSG